jgi:putative ABC transport system permease protein
MWQNNLKIAIRTLWKQKGITAINVVGIAAGMAVCLLVGLLLWDHWTYDNFHPGADRLYRVVMEVDGTSTWAPTPDGVAPGLRREVAGVEAATQLRSARGTIVAGGYRYSVQGYYAERSFFEGFGFALTAGSETDALAAPGSAVITRDLAERLYGEADPIGQTFEHPETGPVTVTGVIDREDYRSHLTFDVLYSHATRPESDRSLGGTYAYLRLAPEQSVEDIAPSLRSIEGKYLPRPDDLPGEASPVGFELQAVADLPLTDRQMMIENASGMLHPTWAYLLAGCAPLVLLAAGFNYVNLSTARSLTRGREVGVRKVLGAHRLQVMGPFLAEAVLVALGALAIGAIALQGLVPVFNGLPVIYENNLEIKLQPGPWFYGAFALFAAGIGLLAGLFPAWHLSAFQPSRILKHSGKRGSPGIRGITLRKTLIVLQFTIALVVIVTAALLYRQTAHMSVAEDAGIRTDRLLYVDLQGVGHEAFRHETQVLEGIQQVGFASHVPLGGVEQTGVLLESPGLPESITARSFAVNYEWIEVLGLSFLASGEWSKERFESGQAILINETATDRLGFETPQEALGEPITVSRFGDNWEVRVAGVVRDIFLSFREEPSDPVIFQYDPSRFSVAMLRVGEGQSQLARQGLEEAWTQFDAGGPLEAQSFRALIVSNSAGVLKDAGWILGVLAGLAILIGGLGLLGIATYEVQTRTREIGIRKALGASVASIAGLLSKDALWPIGAAIVLGVPAAWRLNQWWLEDFAYRIELSGATFVGGAAAITAVALLALAPQAMHAARINPAETLREE